MKTLIIYDDQLSEIKFFIVDGDLSHYHGIAINSGDNVFEKECSEWLFDMETGEGFHVTFISQFLTDDVIFQETGERVKIVEKLSGQLGIGRELVIRFDDGRHLTVSTGDVLVPYNLKKE